MRSGACSAGRTTGLGQNASGVPGHAGCSGNRSTISGFGDRRGGQQIAGHGKLGKVAFFAPTLEGFDAGVSAFYPVRQPSALLVPWQGFQPFAAYCRSSQPDAQAERCP
jgi:hypothetical protein